MDSTRLKAVIDLHDYIETLEHDRPPIGVFLKTLGITPQSMSDCVKQITVASALTHPEVAIEAVNYLFKLGVTIGYKYAVGRAMEKEFSLDPED